MCCCDLFYIICYPSRRSLLRESDGTRLSRYYEEERSSKDDNDSVTCTKVVLE